MSSFRHPRRALAVAMTSAALVGAGGVAAVAVALDDDGAATSAPQVTVEAATPTANTATQTVSQIYRQSSKAVVEVTVSSATEADPFGGGGTQQGQGSGFVYDREGRIVTNEHVVSGAQRVSVRFWNGKTYDATVVGTDPSADLAVLDVNAPASMLQPLQLGDSDALQVGQGVVAIGSPFGLEQTVTSGIVSALNRQITAPNNFPIDGAIQTDAAINKGNSGGPLLDLSGRVIGVNSQIESASGGNDGVGFAVPSNTVARVAKALIENGSVKYAYLGVATADTADGNGASIAEVRAGTPAARSGLRSGDVVTAIDGENITSAAQLRRLIGSKQPGDEVELTVQRNGGTRRFQVTLGSRPSA